MQLPDVRGTGWEISEIGYGMWGMAGWTGSDDAETMRALRRASSSAATSSTRPGRTATGKARQLLGELLKRASGQAAVRRDQDPAEEPRVAGARGVPLDEVFPADHIREYTEKSLENLGVDTIDLQQFHVWSDAWAADERWQRAVET